jgi:hypothetical protein
MLNYQRVWIGFREHKNWKYITSHQSNDLNATVFLVCPEFRKRGSILRYAVHASGLVVMNHGWFSHLKSSYGALPLTSWDAHPSSI